MKYKHIQNFEMNEGNHKTADEQTTFDDTILGSDTSLPFNAYF